MSTEVVGATFAAALAVGTGPFASVVAAAATPLAMRLAERVAAEWRRKSKVVEESTLASSGLSPEELCDSVTGDPDMIALTQQVLWAASMSGSEQKLRGLGYLLGRAAANPGDRIDETRVIIAALADLEAPQLLVLDTLTDPAPDQETMGPETGWTSEQVTARVPIDPGFVPACISTLTRHGLATSPVTWDGLNKFVPTQLGRAIASTMRGLAREPEQGTGLRA